MSITSSNNQRIHSDFSELLKRHPGLTDWLLNIAQTREADAEELLPAFLTECTRQNIADTAYPFTMNDQGLGDLRRYLASISFEFRGRQKKEPAPPTPSVTQMISEAPDMSVDDSTSQITEEETQERPEILVKPNSTQKKTLADSAQTEQQPEENLETSTEEENGDATELDVPSVTVTLSEVQSENSQVTPQDRQVVDNQSEATTPKTAVEQPVATPETIAEVLTEKVTEASTVQTEPPSEQIADNEVTSPETSSEKDSVPAEPESEKDRQDVIPGESPLLVAKVKREEAQAELPTEKHASNNEAIAPEGRNEQIENSVSQPEAGTKKTDNQTTKISAGSFKFFHSPGGWKKRRQPSASTQTKRQRRPKTRRQRIAALVLLMLILGAILIPAGFLINFGVKAYSTYQELSAEAHSAVGHLLNVKKILMGNSSHLNGLLDITKLRKAQQEFLASGQDFQQLQNQLKDSDTINTIVNYFPSYRTTLKSAQLASVIGIDVAKIGQIGTQHAIELAPNLSGPLLAHSEKPLVTQPMLDTIGVAIDQVTPLLRDIQANASGLSLSSLPISAQEKAQIEPLLLQLPQITNDLGLIRNLLGASSWLLGVAQPRTFLVQTMDRAELRGSGGFTGQYGEMTISGGRLAPFGLKDISLIEYVDGSANQGQSAPEQYSTWWPFANFGLRDSNISADFPTTAQTAINLYKQEVGKSVDGIISFTPIVIEHILNIIGPITISSYNITVTAQNLEDVLHFYQLDNSGIYKQKEKQPDDASTSARKRFTNNLASLFMDKLRAASPTELLAIAHQVLYDLKTKDLQMYFTDATAEHILMQYGYAAQLDRSTTHDGFYVVQQNLSASKASQYVATTMNDTITLDNKGGATHLLQLRLVYNQAGPVYGYDTYYDYLRVYVPPNSQLLWGKGFATGTPLCGGSYGDCPTD
ncbi:MAG TPA: DUF4012 domain-containing protein, partial [Ktedonobacteraceae bacterium]|nr:DUF4012 domain-containing protein [Ktedonobacteraceae bacterium]